MTTILITGSNRGIGLALAAKFLDLGDRVIATARNPEKAVELRALGERFGENLEVEKLDVTDHVGVRRLAEKLRAGDRVVDVLVNNAGIISETDDDSLEELDLSELERTFLVNVVGVAHLSQGLLPVLRKSRNPRIVNISSGAGSISDKNDSRNICYSVSKAALNQLSRAMAADLRESRIVVVPITPGWVRTDMGGEHADLSAEEAASALVSTIKKLTMKQSGLFLDRHGRSGVYNW